MHSGAVVSVTAERINPFPTKALPIPVCRLDRRAGACSRRNATAFEMFVYSCDVTNSYIQNSIKCLTRSAGASPRPTIPLPEKWQFVGEPWKFGMTGWDGRVAVTEATGPKVTVGGKTYELIGYDKDGAKVYQDAEVVKEQRGQLKEKDDQTQENREKNLRFIENDAKIKAQSGLPKKLVGLPDEKLKHPVKIDISPQKPGDFEFHAIAPKAADLTEVEIMAGEGTSTPLRDVRRLYEV